MKLLTVAIVLLIVSFTLKFAKLIIKRVGENQAFGKRIHTVEPILGLLVWIIVIFWGIYFLFYEKPYYNFIVFALIILVFLSVSWFFVKDFMAGVAFKVQNDYTPGDMVQFGEISGKLDAQLLTHVSIYTREGKLVKIPYSRLSNEIISQKSVTGSFDQNQYKLKVPKKYNEDEAKIILLSMLLNSPWRISNKMPAVNLKAKTSEYLEYEIQVETRNEKHFNYVISHLKKRFEAD